MSIVESVALGGSFKGFFVVEDVILEPFDLLHELMVLHHGVGFSIGDGGEKSICNGAKEYSVDVVVGGEG